MNEIGQTGLANTTVIIILAYTAIAHDASYINMKAKAVSNRRKRKVWTEKKMTVVTLFLDYYHLVNTQISFSGYIVFNGRRS